MPEGPSFVIDGKRCQLHYFTGKVLSSQKRKETQVHSQSYGTQNTPQVSVTSTTVIITSSCSPTRAVGSAHSK